MKLYRRQLNSLEELRREKQRLKAKLNDDPIMPVHKATATAVADEEGGNMPPLLSTIADALSSPQVKDILGAVGMPLLSLVGGQIKRKAVMNIAKELVGGYVKWKAVELGYKAIRSYMKKQKAKKQAEKAVKV